MPWLAKKTSPLTEEFLEELDRLDKEARPGPWELEKQPGTGTHAVSRVIAGFFAWKAPTPDARLIVQMRNALSALITEVREARTARSSSRRLRARQPGRMSASPTRQ